MLYIQLGENSRVIAWTDCPENPDDEVWHESPWDEVPSDFDDWLYVDGQLVHDPRDLPPVPYSAEQVITALFQETDAMDSLPDDVLNHMAPYMAEWKADRAYKLGDKVQYLDRPYRVLQDHTSHEAYPPDAAVSLYARILAGGGDDYPVWEQPDSTNPYMTGDRVHYPDKDGPVYESIIDNNVFSPEVYPAGWQLVEEAA